MEEENNQEVTQEKTQQVKENITENLKKFDFKKYGPIIGGAVAVIVVLAIVISSLVGGPKKAVKKYINAINSKNAKKIVKCVDLAGEQAWKYSYGTDEELSKEEYEEFKEAYSKVDKDELKKYTDRTVEYMDDTMDDFEDEYKSFKLKIKEIKSVKKLGKDLYAVKTRVHLKAVPKDKDEDTIDESNTMTFVVYKNKLIKTGNLL